MSSCSGFWLNGTDNSILKVLSLPLGCPPISSLIIKRIASFSNCSCREDNQADHGIAEVTFLFYFHFSDFLWLRIRSSFWALYYYFFFHLYCYLKNEKKKTTKPCEGKNTENRKSQFSSCPGTFCVYSHKHVERMSTRGVTGIFFLMHCPFNARSHHRLRVEMLLKQRRSKRKRILSAFEIILYGRSEIIGHNSYWLDFEEWGPERRI